MDVDEVVAAPAGVDVVAGVQEGGVVAVVLEALVEVDLVVVEEEGEVDLVVAEAGAAVAFSYN